MRACRPEPGRCAQAVIGEHRKDTLLEAQARAVEYAQMFQYDTLRPQLLEHMPPLDAAAYARSAAAAGKLDAAPAELVGRSPVQHCSDFHIAPCNLSWMRRLPNWEASALPK